MPPAADSFETEAIVLRKTPYSDTSLIIACVSPEYGQIHFLAKGALKASKRQFPEIDLFRLLSIRFTEGRQSDLCTIRECEAIDYYDRVSQFPAQYTMAQWVGQFVLKNVKDHHQCPDTFKALSVILERLSSKRREDLLVCLNAFLFVFLYEEGVLTHGDDMTDSVKGRKLNTLMTYALDKTADQPDHENESLVRVRDWLQDFMRRHHLTVPDGLERFV